MLKTLDILIGATTVVLIFALAVTVLTQALTSLFSRKGEHLRSGLATLVQQLGIAEPAIAEKIATAVLQHPLLSQGAGWGGRVHLGTVIHREEFTKLLLDAASGQEPHMWPTLDDDTRTKLMKMLWERGITDPAAVLTNVRSAAMLLETTNPELATDVRQSMAILQEAASDYVACLNSWFDQTIDRVSQQFAKHTHYVTVVLSTVVVLAVQLDMIAVVNRLSVDDALRSKIVDSASKDPRMQSAVKETAASTPQQETGGLQNQLYYDALGQAGLITFPFNMHWLQEWDTRKIPGMILAILLVSLGAPFWYNILKDLLGLRSSLAKKDDLQRTIRQTTQEVAPAVSGFSVVSAKPPGAVGANPP